jgi:hypothetical protein
MRIPKEVETAVVTKLYADAEAVDWATMTPQEHSAQYAAWVDDPLVGGRLQEYVTAGDARVWIKDGPMKEWARSHSGIGKYSHFVEGADDVQALLARKAVGDGWQPDPQTLQIKPARMLVRNGEHEKVLTWAPAAGLKHLVWAALVAAAEGDSRPWVLAVVETLTKPTPANERKAHQRLAARTGLTIIHVSL